MKKFEYITFQTKLTDTDLNKLGLEGWEMVTQQPSLLGLKER